MKWFARLSNYLVARRVSIEKLDEPGIKLHTGSRGVARRLGVEVEGEKVDDDVPCRRIHHGTNGDGV